MQIKKLYAVNHASYKINYRVRAGPSVRAPEYMLYTCCSKLIRLFTDRGIVIYRLVMLCTTDWLSMEDAKTTFIPAAFNILRLLSDSVTFIKTGKALISSKREICQTTRLNNREATAAPNQD